MTFDEFISKNLDQQQFQAVSKSDGPLLILAGAGSGKTRALTYRVAHLIAQGKAHPQEIFAVTFTNKAANEMKNRIGQLLNQMGIGFNDHSSMWISTFHSAGVRILREHIYLLDYPPFFAIFDDSDQLSQIKSVLKILNINDKIYPAKNFQSRINQAKMMAYTPDDVLKKSIHFLDEKSHQVYAQYEKEMKKNHALDFGDLLFKTQQLFQQYPDLLAQYQNQFKYLLVDEYQDTNHIQYLLIKQLAAKHRNICVVGDEDQSIYSWRGADITNILSFEKDYPEAQVIKLEQNYRSSKNIVLAARKVIENNTQRKEKTLFTHNPQGEKIHVQEENSEHDEARFVAQQIASLTQYKNYSYKDIAIFYRTNAQSRVIEEQLRSHQIPYRIIGGLKFYDRMEIKNILAYMRLCLNPNDDVAAKRIINVPARGIGKNSVALIEDITMKDQTSFLQAAQKCSDHRLLHTSAVKKTRHFVNLIEELRLFSQNHSLSALFDQILFVTEYITKLKLEDTPEAKARIENLEEFHHSLFQFERERGEEATLQAFLEEIALINDIDKHNHNDQSITLMTLHISKGLEYPVAFIIGLEEGLFPSIQSADGTDPTRLEEERRLAYVGMTRAEELLYLCFARTRWIWGNQQSNIPSRFIDEIPKEFIQFHSSIRGLGFMKRHRSESGFLNNGPCLSVVSDTELNSCDEFPNYEDFSDDPDCSQGFKKGMKVKHPTFGVGSIFKTEGSGDNQKVNVIFNNQMVKKFIVKYARLEPIR